MLKFETPSLPYEYNALEPYIDEATMQIHHDKHHVAYTSNFNKALEGLDNIGDNTAEDILRNLDKIPENVRNAVKNHGGGHVHHSLFWQIMRPAQDNNAPDGELLEAIIKTFGSFDKFREEFTTAAVGVFGSGWAWLVIENGQLKITQTSKQDSPYSLGQEPILGIDVWEHSYYLKYQNRRAEFIEAFWNVINWPKVAELYSNIK